MEKNLLRNYRQLKEIQLVLLIIFTGVFFSCFLYSPTVRGNILTNHSLLFVYGTCWIILLIAYLFLLYDFRKMELYIEQEHALKREAYLDGLTGLPNRHGFDTVFAHYQSGKNLSNLGCALLTIDNLEEINLTNGHETGDLIIKNICKLLEEIGDKYGFIGRNGGNEFLAVFDDCTEVVMHNFHEDLNSALSKLNKSDVETPEILINFFYLLNSNANVTSLSDLVTLTYKKAAIK